VAELWNITVHIFYALCPNFILNYHISDSFEVLKKSKCSGQNQTPKKVKCAFAAERYLPDKMESFYVRNLVPSEPNFGQAAI
jgi:hypothetical protein